MGAPVAAASDAAATRLDVHASGPCVSLTVRSDVTRTSGRASAGPDGVVADVAVRNVATEMEGVLRGLRGDVRAVVLRGLHHLPELLPAPAHLAYPDHSVEPSVAAPPVEAAGDDLAPWRRLTRRLSERADLLSVAVLAGPITGPGLALAFACDLRVVVEDASLRLKEAVHGLVPTAGVAGALVELVGYTRALHLCLTGQPVGAREAVALGLATLVVPASQLDAEVDRLVATLLTVPRDAATETKSLLAQARDHRAALRHDADADAEAEAVDRLRAAASGNVG